MAEEKMVETASRPEKWFLLAVVTAVLVWSGIAPNDRLTWFMEIDPVYGARPLKRAIQQQLENPLAEKILGGEFGPDSTVKVDAEGGHLVFAHS